MRNRRHRVWLLVLPLVAACLCAGWIAPGSARAQAPPEKPVVYNHITGAGAALDQLVHQTYDAEFRVIDFANRDGTYVPPVRKSGVQPAAPVDAHGSPIEGVVVVLYIISQDGWVMRPVIIRSTDSRLNPWVVDAMASWRFDPGRVDGRAVSTTAGEEFDLTAAKPK